MKHRGPDGGGSLVLKAANGRYSAALGHRRLSIIDLSDAGAQPMWSACRSLCITFNGEIYNYIELREELTAKGRRFRSNSDTEVLLEAYRAWGKDAIRRLRGMFAFAIFDARRQSLILARDAFGKKPLFYWEKNGDVAFGSEIEPLLAFPGLDRAFDWSALDHYLLNRYAPSPQTFFRHVRKLPPGCLAHWREGELKIERFFTPPFATTRPDLTDYEEAARMFERAFDEAVSIRMRSDAAFGAYLSGGLDSSAVVAAMTRHSPKKVKTFSVGFTEKDYSELDHAGSVANHLETDHHSLVIGPDDFFGGWDEAVLRRGAPVSEASDIPILLLSRFARNSVKMALTGEGADELLAGYPKHMAERFVDVYQSLVPRFAHDRLIAPAVERLPCGARRIKILTKALGQRNLRDRMRFWFGGLSPDERRRLLSRAEDTAPPDEFPFSANIGSNLRRTQFFDQTSWLPDNLLERGDRMMMAGSIEGRTPFMDTELASLVARFPDSFLVRHPKGKAILRHVMAKRLPAAILHRKKVGFRVPVDEWFRSSHQTALRDLLCSESSEVRRLLNAEAIDALVKAHTSGRASNERILWSLCNLEKFFRIYKPDLGAACAQMHAGAV
jgi:asparagine synthase (glutamine-hydrolysing)